MFGGTSDMLTHQKEGFLYAYTEAEVLAEYIRKYFQDDDICLQYGKNAAKRAKERHNEENNVKQLVEIYQEINSK